MSGDDPLRDADGEGDSSGRRSDFPAKNDEASSATASRAFRTTFDRQSESVCVAVISAVAAVSNTRPKELEPLQGVVDTDALDALFQPGSHGHVTFPYSGYEVNVRSDGELTLAPERD